MNAPNLAPQPSAAPVAFGSAELKALIGVIASGAEARDRGETDAREAIGLAKGARLGALRLAKADGGAGARLTELFEVVLALGEADSNIPHILRNHFAITERSLRVPHSTKHRRWLELTRDGWIFGLGASELGTQNIGDGSSRTSLTPDGDGFRLNGKKYYSTGNYYADILYVHASDAAGERVAAVVPVDRAGIDRTDDWDGIGQRLTASGTTTFTDVRVEADEVVRIASEELKVPHDATFAQLYLSTIVAGILKAIVRDAGKLLKSRGRNYYHATSATPAEDPQLQEIIGRLASTAYVAEAAVLRAAEALERAYDSALAGAPDPDLFEEASLRTAKTKVVIDELALTAATRLFDVGGASAAKQSARLDRHWRNIRTISSHNPVAYKARALGANALDGTPLPTAAFF